MKAGIYNVNFLDKLDRSPIFYSVIKNDYDSVRALYGKLAFLDFEDTFSKTVLEYARETENESVLSFLIESGANLGKGLFKGVELLFESI